MKGSVLLIEDDARIRAIVEEGLRGRGFDVVSASDARSGLALARREGVDLVLLDLMLPDAHGLRVLRAIRSVAPRLPVVALTALDDMDSKLDGFDAGFDDYVTKPFSIEELAARIRARLRWNDDGQLGVGCLTLDLARHRVRVGDDEFTLAARETELLATFMRNPGRALSRKELLRLVWDIDFETESNVVDVYVAALRRKLGAYTIETVRGVGYRLPVRRAT